MFFGKLRTNNTTAKKEEENKEESNDKNIDSLFAAEPAERKSHYGKVMKRGLSEDFLSQVNQNNLMNKVKDVKKQVGDDDANSGRNSVSSNIALF